MKQEFGVPFSRTATGSSAASANQAAVSGTRYYVTDISGSTDKIGGQIKVLDGTNILWQDVITNQGTTGAPAFYSRTFATPLKCSSGATASVSVDGVSVCTANLAGFSNNS